MTQQQQISLLTSIMPEINETHDPRGVMLKCAEKHNLSPAQLEKLGHVYNTAKTLVGLEKQAHRGDSFSIVDVPEMVASYTTFDPEKEVAKGSRKVHQTANRLLKCAADEGRLSYWTRKFMELGGMGQEKSASTEGDRGVTRGDKLPTVLDDLLHGDKRFIYTNEADGNTWEEIPLPGGATMSGVTKSAAASMKYVSSQMKKAAEEAREAMYDASEHSKDLVRGLKEKLVKSGMKEDMWPQMVEDLDDYFSDRVKVEKVAHYIASHLEYDHNCRVPEVNLEKRAKRMIARDRYGIFKVAEELIECADAFKDAKELYESLTEGADEEDTSGELKLASSTGDDFTQLVKDRGKGMSDFIEAATGLKKKDKQEFEVNEAVDSAKDRATLQQLLMSDPVIAEADPNEVQDLFTTISSLNPTVAKDVNLMGPVIKESLQYGSIPIQMLKDLVSIDAQKQQAEVSRHKNEEYAKGDNRKGIIYDGR